MDVVQQLANMGNEFISWMQILGVVGAAISFGVGGFQQIFGGAEGLRKAKPWYIGAGVGLIFILGSSAIATFLESKITF